MGSLQASMTSKKSGAATVRDNGLSADFALLAAPLDIRRLQAGFLSSHQNRCATEKTEHPYLSVSMLAWRFMKDAQGSPCPLPLHKMRHSSRTA